jgi:hypothetical protein
VSAAAGEAMAAARTAISAVVSRNERILPNFALTRARAGPRTFRGVGGGDGCHGRFGTQKPTVGKMLGLRPLMRALALDRTLA